MAVWLVRVRIEVDAEYVVDDEDGEYDPVELAYNEADNEFDCHSDTIIEVGKVTAMEVLPHGKEKV